VNTGRQRQALKGLEGQIYYVQFSADGKRLAAAAMGKGIVSMIGMWDVSSGERLGELIRAERVHSLTFSPDGKTLTSGSSRGGPRLWDATTGHELRRFAGPAFAGLAFSPDGKWLAGAGADEDQDEDQKVHVWEVNTGLEVRAFHGHVGLVLSVAFAPDGRTLASGGFDSTVLLWDFTGRMRNGRLQTANWTQQRLEQRWKDLASRDGKRALQAVWDLAASPEQAVPMLRQRIEPAQLADAKRVERLIRDLDSEVFETRTKATEELEKIIDRAEPALRKKLAEKPSLEMRRRIEEVLVKLEPSGERLRALRAIQVLEYIGTAEAREHLRVLTKGVAEAQLTCEAKAALLRLTN
jgi:WD40 repeat protein